MAHEPSAPSAEPQPSADPAPAESTAPLPGATSPSESTPAVPPLSPKALFLLERLDWLLVGLALLLCFLLGSVIIYNSDFWLYLAIGRSIAEGEYQIGVDPFAYTTQGVTWVNHHWLFSWVLYVLYGLIGGEGLTVLKAILLAAFGVVLIQIRRRDQTLWLPVGITALSVLVLSNRVVLQPALISYLFLGFTLCVLYRAGALAGGDMKAHASPKVLWWLLPLFVLWVNMDSWFFLGPLMVGWCALGALIESLLGWKPTIAAGRLALVFVAGLAVCLVNPHHVQAFSLPFELGYMLVSLPGLGENLPDFLVGNGRALVQIQKYDADFLPQLSSLARPVYWPENGSPVFAGLAFFPLLILGLLSFVMAAPVLRQEGGAGLDVSRALAFGCFALLALLQVRLSPFFAVVAGPITVLNFQDYWAWHRSRPSPNSTLFAVLGPRLGIAAALVILLVLAWPGWLHGNIGDFTSLRRVAWGVRIDPSWENAADKLDKLHTDGAIQHGFTYSLDLGHYCAWACPQAKVFLDSRFALFLRVAEDYGKIRTLLRLEANQFLFGQPGASGGWRDLFAKYDIDHVLLSNFHREPATRNMTTFLWLHPADWAMLFGDGRSLVFGWRGPEQQRSFAKHLHDWDRLAFGPVPAEARCPDKMPQPVTAPLESWISFVFGKPAPQLALDRARMEAQYFSSMSAFWRHHQLWFWRALVWNTPVLAGCHAAGAFAGPLSVFTHVIVPTFEYDERIQRGRIQVRTRDYGPPAAPILMLRDARRAVAHDPFEPAAYATMADAVSQLWHSLEDYWANYAGAGPFSYRSTLRQVQHLYALRSYLSLMPDDPNVHLLVAEAYDQLNYLDLALGHRKLALQHIDRLKPDPRNLRALDGFMKQKQGLEQMVLGLEGEIKRRKEDFDLRSLNRTGLEKYALALHGPYEVVDAKKNKRVEPLGLAGHAQVVLDSLPTDANTIWARFSLYLLTGRVADALRINPQVQPFKGREHEYLEMQAFLGAALGEYAFAEKTLAEAERLMAAEPYIPLYGPARDADRALLVLPLLPLFPRPVDLETVKRQHLSHWEFALQKTANYRLVRGLLALEDGDTAKALDLLKRTVGLVEDARLSFAELPIAKRYVELLMKNQP